MPMKHGPRSTAHGLRRFITLLTGLLLAGCTRAPLPPPASIAAPTPIVIRIGVAESATAVRTLTADAYTAQFPDVALQWTAATRRTLQMELLAGRLDVLLLHEPPANEAVWFNPVALDGLVMVAHPSLPLDALSRADLQAIWRGQIDNWTAVAGPDLPITLLSRERGAAPRDLLVDRLLRPQPLTVNAQLVADDAALLTAVAETPGALGMSMMGNALGAPVQVLGVDGRFPTPAEAAAQTYPFTVPLYAVTAGTDAPTGPARDWIAWLQADAGQALLAERYGRVR